MSEPTQTLFDAIVLELTDIDAETLKHNPEFEHDIMCNASRIEMVVDQYLSRLEAKLSSLQEINNNAQYVIASLASRCAHCFRPKPVSGCPAGSPGCGLADDMSLETNELKAFVEKLK